MKLIRKLIKNEHGLTLIEFIAYLTFGLIISFVANKTLVTQIDQYKRINSTLIYEELDSINRYFDDMTSSDYKVNYTENSIELVNSMYKVTLEDSKDGVRLIRKELTTDMDAISVPFKHLNDFRVIQLDTVVLKGTTNGTDLLYRIPVKNTFQVIFNEEPTVDKYAIKEVVTYAFE